MKNKIDSNELKRTLEQFDCAGRGTETEESLARRLEAAVGDMAFGEAGANFDTVIVNEELEIAYSAFLAFVREKYPGLG